jgi:UDP-N-acetylmuramoyl-tripeptide--D-alanyl-D-alanine ligase
VVSEQWANANPTTAPLWVVPDPESALQTLAEKWRLSFALPMLAITGTNGKTTTRTMGAAILKHKYNLHTTAGNFNNHLGLPITLLNLRPAHDFSLLEIGTNHFGEIARLCEIAHPNAGLITNIGWGHTEFFGNIKGGRPRQVGTVLCPAVRWRAFVNADDALIATMPLECRKVTFGFDTAAADYRAKIMAYTDNGCALLNINDRLISSWLFPEESPP